MSVLVGLGVRVCFRALQGVTHGGQHEVMSRNLHGAG